MPLNLGKVVYTGNEHVTYELVPCPECGSTGEITLRRDALEAYHDGAFIQHAFPELTPDIRERMMTGICGPCFDKLFGEEDE